MTSLLPTSPRARAWGPAVLVALVLVVLSPAFGRADVTGQYRPLVPPDGLTTGCYPLPGDVALDFDHVLRSDSDIVSAKGIRRQVVLHYDRVDGAEAAAIAEQQFDDAGVGDDVSLRVRDFEGIAEDAVVRGEMVLDLPATGRQGDDPICDNIYSTKRFTPDLPDRS